MNYWNTGGRPPESNPDHDNLLIRKVIVFLSFYLQLPKISLLIPFMADEDCLMRVLSRVWLCETPWTEALQAPLSMGFSKQEYWSGLPCPPPGDLPKPRMESAFPVSPALQEDSFPLRHQGCHGGSLLCASVLQTESCLFNTLFNATRAPWDLMKYLVQRDTRLI